MERDIQIKSIQAQYYTLEMILFVFVMVMIAKWFIELDFKIIQIMMFSSE